jgi:hypothetical protein
LCWQAGTAAPEKACVAVKFVASRQGVVHKALTAAPAFFQAEEQPCKSNA